MYMDCYYYENFKHRNKIIFKRAMVDMEKVFMLKHEHEL